MARKESEKETDRPRYYSQFWLDIAAGRKTIGATKLGDEADIIEPEIEEPAPRRSIRSSASRYEPVIMHPMVEPEEEEEEEFPAEQPEEMEMAEDEIGDEDIPNILVEEVEDTEDTAVLADEEAAEDEVVEEEPLSLEEEEEDFFEDEEEEEDEDWPGRGRKKPKGRQTRLPASPKKPKRERRGGF